MQTIIKRCSMKRSLFTCFSLVISVFLTTCKTSNESDLKHKAEQPTEENVSLLWHEVTKAEYATHILSMIQERAKPEEVRLITNQDPIYQKWQSILTSIHEELKKRDPETLKNIPAPRLVLIDNLTQPVVNAFVAPLVICYKVPIIFHDNDNLETIMSDDGVNLNQLAKDRGYGIISNGRFSFLNSSEMQDCIERQPNQREFKKLITWINNHTFDRSKTKCRLSLESVDGNDRVRVSKECEVDPDLAAMTSKGSFIFYSATGNTITVYKDLIDYLTEDDQIAGVLAHELGHYYKAHGSFETEIHNYFYDLGEYAHADYPERKNSFDKIGKLVVHIEPPGDAYARIEDSTFHPMLYSFFHDQIRNEVCDDNFCPDECKNIQSPQLVFNEDDFRLKEYDRSSVVLFESQINSCLDTNIKILEGYLARRNFIKKYPNKPSLNSLQLRSSLKFDYPFLNACIEEIPLVTTLKDLYFALNAKLSSEYCNQRLVLKEAENNTLGFYTAEQQADDLALEFLTLLNKSPEEYQLGLLKLSGFAGDPGCEKWLKNQEGKPIPVLTNYSNAHHDTCFRWHEVGQEIARHNYSSKD